MTTPDDPRPGDGRPDDDIDAEFARMMEGLDLEEPEPPSADATSDADGELTELTVEDVLGTAEGVEDPDAPRPIAVVATSVASAKALAGALRLASDTRSETAETPEGTHILDTDSGAIALGALDETSAHELAAQISGALQRLGIVLFWRRGDRMTATRYRQGERGEDVSPTILLGGVAPAVEQLLLGSVDAEELGEGIDPRGVTRMQALRWIATGRRKR
ncbi:hypothetical protein BRM3_07950 [Brachybacterium huguangmaarense]|uniref:Uncharacterized protein n=1 Tax=Brachybacterium huguangmaarense TaxID=1652028 RepID=A0ABY6FYU1_9MICO|nr:hypothetical protein [Brachybacterium huguangmaarense]UYG15583.1 hypothetical protein BRM3_07950 [Brachybacterium huguangmaarense]